MRRPETTNTPPPVLSDEATRAYGAPGALAARWGAPRDAFLIAHDRMTVLAGLAAGRAVGAGGLVAQDGRRGVRRLGAAHM